MILALTILIAYLAGSIPSGVWLGQALRGIDIREHGSGNSGAANAARVLGVPWGVTVGVVDVLKGFAPVFWLGPTAAIASGLALGDARLILGAAAIIGHLYPLFARFKGGKGVLTGTGVMLGLLPIEVGIAAAIWVVVFVISRTVSIGSLTAILALMVAVFARRFVFHVPIANSLIVATLLLVVLVFWTHRSNIRRLKEKREARFGRKCEEPPTS